MIKIIDRYITTELIKPFIMVIFAFIVVMITIRLGEDVDKIVRENIPYMIILKTIVFKIPDYIIQAFPIAFLMATLLTTSRFSRDHETTALRSGGIKFKRLMLPILFNSLVISFISFQMNERLIPLTSKYGQKAWDEYSRIQNKGQMPADSNNIYFRGPDNKFFHVQRFDRSTQTMENIVVANTDNTKDREVIVAQSGSWKNNVWTLKNGIIHFYPSGSDFTFREEKFNVTTLDVKVNLEDIIAQQKNPQELTIVKLKQLIDARKTAGFEARELEVEYYLRYARACATFFAAVISAPMGFIFARLGNYIGVALSIILIFIYYVAESIGRVIGINGIVPTYTASWSSNIVFAVIGLVLLWQSDRR